MNAHFGQFVDVAGKAREYPAAVIEAATAWIVACLTAEGEVASLAS